MMAEIKPIRTAAEIGLAEAFAALRPRLAGTAVAPRREAAFRRFEAVGLPHRRVEDWKYTDLRALMRDAKPLATPPDEAVKARARSAVGVLLITHYQRLLNYIVPDVVHVMVRGRIVRTGGKELALALEERGYDWIIKEEELEEPAAV